MRLMKFNCYAPDIEGTVFTAGNAPEDAKRLADQVEGYERGLRVVEAKPSFHGSFDVVVEGTKEDLEWLREELDAEDAVISED